MRPPSRLAGLVRDQLGLARALGRAVRGRTDTEDGDVPLPYNGMDRAVLWTILVLGVLETVIVHVLVSWPPLRWTLFALGVYGVLGLLAFDLTMRQHPHLLRRGELLLRFGHFRTVRVPLDRLVSVRSHVRDDHARNVDLGDDATVSFMGGTNVELRFSPPVEVEADGRRHTVVRMSFAAADPAAVVALLRAQTTAPGRRPPTQMLAPSGGGPSGSGAAKPEPDGGGGFIPTV
jgi:hypothetical protein